MRVGLHFGPEIGRGWGRENFPRGRESFPRIGVAKEEKGHRTKQR